MKEAFDKIVRGLLAPFISKYVGSFVRTALAALGGYLISQQWADAETADNFIKAFEALLIGIIPVLIAQLSSLVEKNLREK